MKERSARSALTTYGIALAVVFAIIGLLWWQKKPDETATNVQQIQEPAPEPVAEQPPSVGGTTGTPAVGSVTTIGAPMPTPRGDPYGPAGPFGPGGPGGPLGPIGPSGPKRN